MCHWLGMWFFSRVFSHVICFFNLDLHICHCVSPLKKTRCGCMCVQWPVQHGARLRVCCRERPLLSPHNLYANTSGKGLTASYGDSLSAHNNLCVILNWYFGSFLWRWNLHTTKRTDLNSLIDSFDKRIQACGNVTQIKYRTFLSPRNFLYALLPWPDFYYGELVLFSVRELRAGGIMQYALACVCLLSLKMCLRPTGVIHVHSFHCWVVFHYMNTQMDGLKGCLQFGATMNKAIIHLQVFLQTCVFISFGKECLAHR